ncbi:neutral ceramidase isoform X2 [Aethina tumida]|nr:neutral ceramidase isoform X2 [Aethina tumida]XP_049821525.1 neutral ceramidase isoform X2 [Aethina tumida]
MSRGWKQLGLFAAVLVVCISRTEADYHIGVGRADCTGPSAEITFMGYAKTGQKGCGIHLRQFARAFILDDGETRAAFVTVDTCMGAHGLRRSVLDKLREKYGEMYTENNLILSGTHTHGTPGGFLMDLMFDLPNLGFSHETFNALVEGIVRAVVNAHENMVQGRIFVTSGEVLEANINRSPASYLYNPEEERAKYAYNVDKTLVQVRMVRSSDQKLIGAINWFAVHPTSMNNTNCLVTSDNVGYASLLLEQSVNKDLPGKGSFVGAFASTNLGDVSPNLKGPHCLDTGLPCDNVTSTCDGDAKKCVSFGPGKDMFESTEIIAKRLFGKASELLIDASAGEITGPIRYVHQFTDMPNEKAEIELEDGTIKEVQGCYPAMGYSFAAGTTDGPGEFDFTQATTSPNPFWNAIRDFIFPPTPEDVECQAPKPILIATGRIDKPYQWQPQIVVNQVVMIGNLVLVAVPGEFTTMSGRRMRDAVKEEVIKNGGQKDVTVVITGLSNVYTNYIATPEEYQLQRYEGASTIFGPHTFTIYKKIYKNLVSSLLQNKTVEPGPTPPDFSNRVWTLIKPVVFDSAGWFGTFGDCIKQPPATANIGDVVSVKFTAGHPRNDVMQEKTFLTVEKYEGDSWKVVATDASWETRFYWTRTNVLFGFSEVEVQWTIKENVEPGTYRIRHFGNYKYIFGGVYPYEGQTKKFTVKV